MPNCVGTYKSSANPASKWYQNLISVKNVVKVDYAGLSRAVGGIKMVHKIAGILSDHIFEGADFSDRCSQVL